MAASSRGVFALQLSHPEAQTHRALFLGVPWSFSIIPSPRPTGRVPSKSHCTGFGLRQVHIAVPRAFGVYPGLGQGQSDLRHHVITLAFLGEAS